MHDKYCIIDNSKVNIMCLILSISVWLILIFFFFLEEYFMYKDILVNESSMFWVAWSSVPIDVGFL